MTKVYRKVKLYLLKERQFYIGVLFCLETLRDHEYAYERVLHTCDLSILLSIAIDHKLFRDSGLESRFQFNETANVFEAKRVHFAKRVEQNSVTSRRSGCTSSQPTVASPLFPLSRLLCPSGLI